MSEIVDSPWLRSVNEYNRASFGTDLSDGPLWDRPRHDFFGGKDSSAQFLAQEVALDVFVEESTRAASEEARAEALRRLDSYPER